MTEQTDLLALIDSYKSDPESVYNTWFVGGAERMKAFRAIRRGVRDTVDAIAAGRFGNDFKGSPLEVVLTASNARSAGQALTVPIESGEVDFTDTLGALDVQLLAGDSKFTAYRPEQALNYFFLAIDVKHPGLRDIRLQHLHAAIPEEPPHVPARIQPFAERDGDRRLRGQRLQCVRVFT